tara:strand:+ start:24 stop:344 length:321 start_codon:yes stop_codon:yes gene_type:complete
MSNFFHHGKYDTNEQARSFSIRCKKWLNPRIGKLCNSAYPHLNLSEVVHRLLTHALDDLESRNGDSQELTEIRSAIAKSKTGIGPKGRLNEKLNASLDRLEGVSKR